MSDQPAPPFPDGPKRSSTVVKCERHGLHYDSAKMAGCVICRREAGGVAGVAGVANGSAAAGSSAGSGSLGGALAVTALLLAATTGALFLTHSVLVDSFLSADQAGGGRLDDGFDQQMEDLGLPADSPADTGEPAEAYSGADGDDGDD